MLASLLPLQTSTRSDAVNGRAGESQPPTVQSGRQDPAKFGSLVREDTREAPGDADASSQRNVRESAKDDAAAAEALRRRRNRHVAEIGQFGRTDRKLPVRAAAEAREQSAAEKTKPAATEDRAGSENLEASRTNPAPASPTGRNENSSAVRPAEAGSSEADAQEVRETGDPAAARTDLELVQADRTEAPGIQTTTTDATLDLQTALVGALEETEGYVEMLASAASDAEAPVASGVPQTVPAIATADVTRAAVPAASPVGVAGVAELPEVVQAGLVASGSSKAKNSPPTGAAFVEGTGLATDEENAASALLAKSGEAVASSGTNPTEAPARASTLPTADASARAPSEVAIAQSGVELKATEAKPAFAGAVPDALDPSRKGALTGLADRGFDPRPAAGGITHALQDVSFFQGLQPRGADLVSGFDRLLAGAPAQQSGGEALRATPLQMLPIEIGMQAIRGATQFQIRLDPAELGRVDVKLEVSRNGEVNASLVVERVETLALLKRDASTLQQAFEQAGLKQSPDGLTFSLRGEGQQGQSQERSPQPRDTKAADEEARKLQTQISDLALRRVLIPNSRIDRMI